mgnify:CR=1 FL=1|tara:strand:- start:320 stop:505 length:186 start_codon:yes stop_codon:yes gene_type:complete
MKKKDFKPHMMYHPKTGKGVKANTYKKHLELKKKGYTHTKPKRKSFAEAVESRMKNKENGY